ncbi:MAG: FG-GAP repeat domain-containing protein [Thermoanaerobaculia bacterium]
MAANRFIVINRFVAAAIAWSALAAAAGDGLALVEDLGDQTEALFRDASTETGLVFVHFNGMVGRFYFPEMTGQGGALFDFDGDGDLDVYFRQGSLLGPDDTLGQAMFPIEGPLGDRLFRNDLMLGDGRPLSRFVDVSAGSGLRDTGYGMGVAVGDYDADGNLDIYLANYGANQLWRNRGDGSFEDVTRPSGTGDRRWSTSATFVDVDVDGDLDLFAANYVDFDVAENPRCFASTSALDYCGPSAFTSLPDSLWLNQGDGTFEDISVKSGLGRARGAGLGVVSGDFNDDGRVDLFVANDGEANHLWLNKGNRTFSDDALFSGTAVNRHGSPEASMGLAAADFDGDGNEDLFLTHLTEESNTFYRNLGDGLYEDRSREMNLAAPSMPFTSFGVAPVDFDNDGWPDLAIANGAVRILLDRAADGDRYPLEQPNQLFRNRGNGTFEEVSGRAGTAFTAAEVSRGLAAGDVDNDGSVELVVFNNNGPARLLVGRALRARWIGVAGIESGARLTVKADSGRKLTRVARTDGSYCSVSDSRLTVGLGEQRPSELRISRTGGDLVVIAPPADSYLVFSWASRSSFAGASDPDTGRQPGARPGR